MPTFKSTWPDILLPTNLTTWDFLFTSSHSPLSRTAPPAAFRNALTSERLNWAQVRDLATRISTALVTRYGLQPGDTVALFSQNTVWYPVAMFACLRVGARISGASPAYNADEMAYALKTAGAKILMTEEKALGVADEAVKKAGMGGSVFLLEGAREGYLGIKELVRMGEQATSQVEAYKIPEGKTNADICGYLSFSSGTTGLPKAVMISHGNVIAQCLQVQFSAPPESRTALAVLPLFHITGLVHQMHLPILLNMEVFMTSSFTMESMLQIVQEHQMRELLLVPPILIRMVRDPVVAKFDTSSIRRFSSGAAPLAPEILEELAKMFPQTAVGKPYGQTGIKQGYGMTESCSCITAFPLHRVTGYQYGNAVGEIVSNTEVKIMKADGTEGGVGEAGEILARGPQICMGYLGNEKATRETFDEEGYLHTGDQGMIDENGMVWILDRIKDLIKVKGQQVAPAELEDLLLGHPVVEDAAVVGIPDEWSGELPKAFVVLKPGIDKNRRVGRALLQFVKENKIRYKWLKEVEIVDLVPKSPSGKILKKDLRNRDPKAPKGVVVRRADSRKKETKL